MQFSDKFKVNSNVIEKYGAVDISLVCDIPLFIDPMLIFNSDKEEYQILHKNIIEYFHFLAKKSDKEFIIKYFGYYNGKALEKMSHYEAPWVNARKGLIATENSNNVISKEDIKDYFDRVKNKYDMLNVLDINRYSDDQFKKAIEM